MAPTRNIFSQPVDNNSRTVTYSMGGLNERFSQLEKSQKPSKINAPSQAQPRQTSVFSRIRGAKANSNATASGRKLSAGIQDRLGKPRNGGIRKPGSGSSAMSGVERTGPLRDRRAVRGGPLRGRGGASQNRRGVPSRGGARVASRGATRGGGRGASNSARAADKPKKVTSEDLDKALDDYMMKDPKTAQSKLDLELTSYMDEADDILMDL
ncbi:hypothetical protein DFQ28_002582 [Apophysomyces sp. BC1034]|nr:hypothetical protein DFQ30_002911 [Apophysomyces sp. BC1015]KAG0179451.1 hypothetical protein DFQ29_002070 [Apophysomyces sp. BC1021]KAG0190035.1 hypothetical protein DFQ28_002582 [Apophysomyces sp. BC1034]